jgi:pyridoxine 5-phosphate synthase
MPTQLSVNLNAVALLRNRRDLPWPSVVGLGRIALAAGAHGLTVHPRPDERHIRASDVADLAKLFVAEFPKREFNIEGYPDARFFQIVEAVEPDQATLVPDEPGQATSDHGWDVAANRPLIEDAIDRLRSLGVRVSLFIDARPEAAGAAAEIGADRVELYTGPYGAAHDDPARAQSELERLSTTAEAARAAKLGVNAGHDLTLANLPPLVARIPFLAEVSIGHALTADALSHGIAEAVRRYLAAAGNPVAP